MVDAQCASVARLRSIAWYNNSSSNTSNILVEHSTRTVCLLYAFILLCSASTVCILVIHLKKYFDFVLLPRQQQSYDMTVVVVIVLPCSTAVRDRRTRACSILSVYMLLAITRCYVATDEHQVQLLKLLLYCTVSAVVACCVVTE